MVITMYFISPSIQKDMTSLFESILQNKKCMRIFLGVLCLVPVLSCILWSSAEKSQIKA